MKIENRFLKYVSYDTQSDPDSDTYPSTPKQLDLANYLVRELQFLGVENAYLDEYGIVYGVIPANNGDEGNGIGFISHMDTSPDAPGNNIKPKLIRNYQGGRIVLNEEREFALDPKSFPALNDLISHDLITTDGTTLLGADDKAGIAIIMQTVEYMHEHPEFRHGKVSIAFTPDEEIGGGTEHFDLDKFEAKRAYTIDGGDIHEVAYENFNAFSIDVEITGKSIHPGDSKNKMINAIKVAYEFNSLLPVHMTPEATEGYEGFNHLLNINGNCDKTEMEYIIRNHDLTKAQKQCDDFKDIRDYLNKKYAYPIVKLTTRQQYLNMRSIIEKDMSIVDHAFEALKNCGIEPISQPIRGGTDGANLTYMGLPCPNLGTGGYNCHGPFEFVSLTMMKKQVEVLVEIIRLSKGDSYVRS